MLTSVTTHKVTGKKSLLIGLSFGNLQRFMDEPLDTFIVVKTEITGLPMDITIMSGETEQQIREFLLSNIVKSN